MVNRILWKDTFREIRHTFSRFLSIFFIVLLGTLFFAGIKAACPDMKYTADKYYDDNTLMDIHIVSTMGLTDEDAEAVRQAPGVKSVFPTHSMDAIVHMYNWDYVVRVFALENPASSSYTGINGVKLISGRMPQAPNECIAERGHDIYPDLPLGTVMKLKSGTDKYISEDLENTEFTVVGIAATPYYITSSYGMSGIGGGSVNSFIMVPDSNFKLDVYTDFFIAVSGAKEQQSYSAGYSDTVKKVKDAIGNISGTREKTRFDKVVGDATEKLNDSKKELADGEEKQRTKLGEGKTKLDDAKKKIEDGEKKIADNEAAFSKGVKAARKAINAGEAKLEEGEKEYAEKYAQYEEAKQLFNTQFPLVQSQIAGLESQIAGIQASIELLNGQLGDPAFTDAQRADIQSQINEAQTELDEDSAMLGEIQTQLAAQQQALSDAEAQLEAGRKALDEGKKELAKGRAKLSRETKKANKELADAKAALSAGKVEYARGLYSYDISKKNSDKELADARVKIADGEKAIAEIKMPEWYILDRDENNPGYSDYGSAANSLDAIANIFPVFFILVTALVCLTTMTRMVEEQRTYIGMLKALGYSKGAIACKYFVYAAFASAAGSAAGVFIGFSVFPSVIGLAYGIMYKMPPISTQIYPSYAVISIVFAVLTTTLSAWAACYRALKDTPAALMRPKAPPPGKRIFLEHIGFIWRKLKFSRKITFRNLFRYKRRLAMTVIGIAGCMALVLAAFGLKDSISTIGEKQFVELNHCDMIIALKSGEESAEKAAVTVGSDKRILEFMTAREQTVTVLKDGGKQSATLFIPESAQKNKSFKTLRERTTGKEIDLTDGGVVITEKLAVILGVSIGDKISIEDGDHNKALVRVDGITEQYAGHTVYMSPELYASAFGKKLVFSEILTRNTGTGNDFENAIATDLMKDDSISAVGFYRYVKEDFDRGIQSLYYVVLVLIISAGALAIVVLYNLTNINIMERIREIATIKVLGFYDLEVSAYVFWENAILTLLGAVVGAVLGIYLHKVLVPAAEAQSLMFVHDIFPASFIYAFLVTALFMVIVNFFMFFRLRKINMVESLKSVE